ncbi:MAG TPA: LUD domain-containing protein [Streptosporangiaceae bacterium]|nr:LUD domain-containing protein [Streptosporangiaceae bacterium]
MSDAKREILHRVRAALGEARGTQVKIPRDYHYRLVGADVATRADVVALFSERLADSLATVRHVGADELGTAVAAALWGAGVRRLVVPADLPYGWLAELDGVQICADSAAAGVDALTEAAGVVTGCAVAIAQTCTIVLDGGRAQGRRALTLLPGYHLCVVHADQIVGSVPEAIERLDPYRPLTWISGAPAAARLEPGRTEGVRHGPRVLDVLVVDEAAPVRAG